MEFKKNNKIELSTLNASSFMNIDEWEQKQRQVIIDNPFIEVVDNKTLALAKKRKSNVVSNRTSLTKQDKAIATGLKGIRSEASEKTNYLISITEPLENDLKNSIDSYVHKKEIEKQEKERIEKERIEKIEIKISEFKGLISLINQMNIKTVEIVEYSIKEKTTELDSFDFEELQVYYDIASKEVNSLFESKNNELIEVENQRLKNLELEEKNRELEDKLKAIELQKKEDERKSYQKQTIENVVNSILIDIEKSNIDNYELIKERSINEINNLSSEFSYKLMSNDFKKKLIETITKALHDRSERLEVDRRERQERFATRVKKIQDLGLKYSVTEEKQGYYELQGLYAYSAYNIYDDTEIVFDENIEKIKQKIVLKKKKEQEQKLILPEIEKVVFQLEIIKEDVKKGFEGITLNTSTMIDFKSNKVNAILNFIDESIRQAKNL